LFVTVFSAKKRTEKILSKSRLIQAVEPKANEREPAVVDEAEDKMEQADLVPNHVAQDSRLHTQTRNSSRR
jgi:hypothetical protein